MGGIESLINKQWDHPCQCGKPRPPSHANGRCTNGDCATPCELTPGPHASAPSFRSSRRCTFHPKPPIRPIVGLPEIGLRSGIPLALKELVPPSRPKADGRLRGEGFCNAAASPVPARIRIAGVMTACDGTRDRTSGTSRSFLIERRGSTGFSSSRTWLPLTSRMPFKSTPASSAASTIEALNRRRERVSKLLVQVVDT